MVGQKIRVAVNGYGVIGKRVADAVRAQPDMTLVGVSDVTEKAAEMRAAGISIAGGFDELLTQIDVVVDCTPKGVGARNLARYRAAGVKAILQGGETHALTGHSFVAQANYASALGLDATRVVSCNTTSTVRTLGALKTAGLWSSHARRVVTRCWTPSARRRGLPSCACAMVSLRSTARWS